MPQWPSQTQLQIMLEHADGPVPFVARGSRPVSIRSLVADSVLSFDQRRLETRLTERGRHILADHLGQMQAAE